MKLSSVLDEMVWDDSVTGRKNFWMKVFWMKLLLDESVKIG